MLETLQAICPHFAAHTLAISGVSGGSIGAASFVALNSTSPPPTRSESACSLDQPQPPPSSLGASAAVERFYSEDLLSPLLAAALFPDALQRVLPVKIPEFDRARSIECAFETALKDSDGTLPGEPCVDGFLPFGGFYPADRTPQPNTPYLFFNTTAVNDGTPYPVLSSRIEYRRVRPAGLGKHAKVDYAIQKRLDGKDLPLSTAAFLSARFPFVMPAANLDNWRYSDGGVFENSGTWFAEQIVRGLQSQITDARAGRGDFSPALRKAIINARVSVIVLRSEPCVIKSGFDSVLSHLSDDCGHNIIEHRPQRGWSELLSPIRAFLNARVARGYDALQAFYDYAEAQGEPFWDRRVACGTARAQAADVADLCWRQLAKEQEASPLPIPVDVHVFRFENETAAHIPLTWTLSRVTRRMYDDAIGDILYEHFWDKARPQADNRELELTDEGYEQVICRLYLTKRVVEAKGRDVAEGCKPALEAWFPPPAREQRVAPSPTNSASSPTQPQGGPSTPAPTTVAPARRDEKPPLPEIDRCEGCAPQTP